MKKTALIIGGTSGLGLELALKLENEYDIFVTGRKDPQKPQLKFIFLDLQTNNLAGNLDCLIGSIPEVDLLIYAAGFYQEGTISDLSDSDIDLMNRVGFDAVMKLVARVLRKQTNLRGFIAITSTSQWTPRLLEPAYTAVKAALGMFANSLSLDERVGKVMVAAPAEMKTKFWAHTNKDTSDMLDPK